MHERNQDPTERKVQIAGGATFTVSLPRAWCDRHDLSKGDSLYIHSGTDRLVIAPSTVDTATNTVQVDTTGLSKDRVVQHVKSAYTSGCQKITVVSRTEPNTDHIRAVSETVREMIGVGVCTVADQNITIEDRLNPKAISLDQSIAQMRQLAIEMQRDAIEAVRTNDETLAELVHERDEEIDRLFAFVSRGFHRGLVDINELNKLDTDWKTGFRYYKMARELERVGDRAERIADAVWAQSAKPDEQIGRRLEKLIFTATDVVCLAMDDDTDGAVEAHQEVTEKLDEIDDELASQNDPDAYLYGTNIVESARRTSARGLNIVNMMTETSVSDLIDH